MEALSVILAAIVPALAHGQATMSCPMQEQHGGSSRHAADVDTRGDKAMGFSHEKSTNHFELLSNGGIIEVSANDKTDTAALDEIGGHLSHVARCSLRETFSSRCLFMTPYRPAFL